MKSSLIYRSDTADDLLYSQSQYGTENHRKSSEQIKLLLQPHQVNNQTEPEEYADSLNQYSKQKTKNILQETQLTKSVQQLKQKLNQQQQQFYTKELGLQEQLLQAQLEHDKLMRLTKSKYELIIADLKQQLKSKDEVIFELNLKLKTIQQSRSEKQFFGKHSKRSSIMTGEELDSEGTYTQRTMNVPTRSSTTQQNDDRLLNLYRHEIDKLKVQTFEFAQKFETEKRSIKDEISLLKNQKQLLQTLLTTKQTPLSDRKVTKSEAKHSCKSRKQENSSIRMPKGKARLRFD